MAAKAKEKKIDIKQFTKYERGRIIGSRATQISQGAPLKIKLSKKEFEKINYDPVTIAKMEFDAGLVDIDVVRPFPDSRNKKKEQEEE